MSMEVQSSKFYKIARVPTLQEVSPIPRTEVGRLIQLLITDTRVQTGAAVLLAPYEDTIALSAYISEDNVDHLSYLYTSVTQIDFRFEHQ